jgi:hypothetical protein
MTRPSRVMPAFVPQTVVVSLWGRGLQFLLAVTALGCLFWAVWVAPIIVVAAFSAVALIGFVAKLDERRCREHLRSIAESRLGESICTFARALPVRQLDTWVVRAVFEQLQSRLGRFYQKFPIRASDRLAEDLLVPEDADEELLLEIAQRAGRSAADLERNPYFGKVSTVEELVRFFCAQARGRTRG